MMPTVSDRFRGTSATRCHKSLPPENDNSLELLLKELQHRIHNLFSVVQCLITNIEADTADDYRFALTARIASLSDAYRLIESSREHRVSGSLVSFDGSNLSNAARQVTCVLQTVVAWREVAAFAGRERKGKSVF